MTSPEIGLWLQLRGRQLGVRFRPQVPRGDYVLDFYCRSLRLAVELDGASHDDRQAQDTHRTRRLLEEFGVRRVIRFSNADVLENMEGVLHQLRGAIAELQQV